MKTATYPTQLQFHDLAAHFLALSPGDRFLRFGWAITDTQIVAYVESLLATGDSVFVMVEPDRAGSGTEHRPVPRCYIRRGPGFPDCSRHVACSIRPIGPLAIQTNETPDLLSVTTP